QGHTNDFTALHVFAWPVGTTTYYFLPNYNTTMSGDAQLTLTVVTNAGEPIPIVNNMFPNSGSSDGGYIVTTEGQYFAQTTGVEPSAKWVQNSDGTITFLSVPNPNAPAIWIYTLHGNKMWGFTYTAAPVPTVTGVTPNTYPVDGMANVVTITGSG